MTLITAGNRVSPKVNTVWRDPPWIGTVERIEGGKALVSITDIYLEPGLVRRLIPPIPAWISVEHMVVMLSGDTG